MARSEPLSAQARLGRAVRDRRRQLGLSLSDLAGELGVAVSTLSKLENGLGPITFERLDSISRILDVDMVALIGDGGARPAAPAAPVAPQNSEYGVRRSVTRAEEAAPVEAGGLYTLYYHATDLLEKQGQPATAEILIDDIADYGPLTKHAGEEFNYVVSGALDFHTSVYAPVRLAAGDSVYFDGEMGHAHIKVGTEKCLLLAVFIRRPGDQGPSHHGPAKLEVTRAGRPA